MALWQIALGGVCMPEHAANRHVTTRPASHKLSALLASLLIVLLSGWSGDSAFAQDNATAQAGFIPKVFAARRIRAMGTELGSSGEQADVYYPAVPRGLTDLFNDRFPVVVLLQGARVDKAYYSQYALGVARHGFVVVVPNHRSPLMGGDDLFAGFSVIDAALDQMRSEDVNPASPLYKIVDTSQLGLSGHSFGGAAGLFAIGGICTFPFCDPASGWSRPPELRAAALVSAHVNAVNIDSTGIPTAIITGTYERNKDLHEISYGNLEQPKALVTVKNVNHFGVCDISEPPGASTRPDETRQTIPQSISAMDYGRWAGLFLRAHIHNDARALELIYESGGNADVTVEAERGL